MRLRLFATIALVVSLPACETLDVFERFEAGGASDAPYPRLVNVPAAPPPGSFSDAAPDPARGRAIRAELDPVAEAQNARAGALAAPVLTEAERRRLAEAAGR
ncbi:MAG: hypothetical protein ACFBWO_04030 [Paracoccaceae bacterium]